MNRALAPANPSLAGFVFHYDFFSKLFRRADNHAPPFLETKYTPKPRSNRRQVRSPLRRLHHIGIEDLVGRRNHLVSLVAILTQENVNGRWLRLREHELHVPSLPVKALLIFS